MLREQKELIVEYAVQNGQIARKEVEELLEAGTTKAFWLLWELCEEGSTIYIYITSVFLILYFLVNQLISNGAFKRSPAVSRIHWEPAVRFLQKPPLYRSHWQEYPVSGACLLPAAGFFAHPPVW